MFINLLSMLVLMKMCLFSVNLFAQQYLPASIVHRDAFFVVSGGSASCKVDTNRRFPSPFTTLISKRFRQMLAKSRGSVRIKFVLTCFTLPATSPIFFSGSDHQNQIFSGNLSQLRSLVDSYLVGLGAPQVYFIGHSWGGWLGMNLAHSLSLYPGPPASLRLIATLDPISKIHCRWLHRGECDRAPTDISQIQQQRIAALSNLWLNFFQTQSHLIHSGPVTFASQNYQVSAPHPDMNTHEGIWKILEEHILPDLI